MSSHKICEEMSEPAAQAALEVRVRHLSAASLRLIKTRVPPSVSYYTEKTIDLMHERDDIRNASLIDPIKSLLIVAEAKLIPRPPPRRVKSLQHHQEAQD